VSYTDFVKYYRNKHRAYGVFRELNAAFNLHVNADNIKLEIFGGDNNMSLILPVLTNNGTIHLVIDKDRYRGLNNINLYKGDVATTLNSSNITFLAKESKKFREFILDCIEFDEEYAKLAH